MSDDATVTAAKAGDPDAWNELYLAYAGRLLLWLRARQVADSAVTAEDVASEAWLVAARRIRHFTGTREEFAGWLFGIGRKVSANQTRRGVLRSTATLLDHDGNDDHPVVTPHDEVVGLDWVRDQLARLPKRERDVLACMEVVGLDVAATAQALGMTAVAVRVTRHRGLKRLRTRMGDDVRPDTETSVDAEADDQHAGQPSALPARMT
ncbi:RNA polymerase sigma factor [Nocardioides oleivorans]|uniref:RNA polymerase sigma factor n=1 Tax=Nocardioides oleivorans TaxID=273676 RepID=UPI0013ECFFF3|nr:sigma-70 family RNA polymerase sigma factor [Nocardioides oleivorans]